MSERIRQLRRGLAAALLTLLVSAPLPAFSQSCALCYTQAAKSGARMIAALQSGILILVIPPVFLTVGFFSVLYRKRHQCKAPAQTTPSGW
jgi:hypothetical protein